jgi:hypothetical protein
MSASSPSLDYRRIAAEITARHGICVKPEDPLMAAATLLELVLEDSGKKFTTEVQHVLGQFASAAERIQARSGAALAQELKQATAAVTQEISRQTDSTKPDARTCVPAEGSRRKEISWQWLAAGWISAALLFVSGFLAGWISHSCG